MGYSKNTPYVGAKNGVVAVVVSRMAKEVLEKESELRNQDLANHRYENIFAQYKNMHDRDKYEFFKDILALYDAQIQYRGNSWRLIFSPDWIAFARYFVFEYKRGQDRITDVA